MNPIVKFTASLILVMLLYTHHRALGQGSDTETITFKVGTETFKMETLKISGGKFKMGSSKEELDLAKQKFKDKPENETEHEVELSTFHMGKYLVTKSQFGLFVKDKKYETEAEKSGEAVGWNRDKNAREKSKDYNWKNPGFPQSDEHPVVCVSRNDAKAFCDWVAEKSRKKVQLPSEAQWEYGCRAGSKALYFFLSVAVLRAEISMLAFVLATTASVSWSCREDADVGQDSDPDQLH